MNDKARKIYLSPTKMRAVFLVPVLMAIIPAGCSKAPSAAEAELIVLKLQKQLEAHNDELEAELEEISNLRERLVEFLMEGEKSVKAVEDQLPFTRIQTELQGFATRARKDFDAERDKLLAEAREELNEDQKKIQLQYLNLLKEYRKVLNGLVDQISERAQAVR